VYGLTKALFGCHRAVCHADFKKVAKLWKNIQCVEAYLQYSWIPTFQQALWELQGGLEIFSLSFPE
jgi:hypothetical protein